METPRPDAPATPFAPGRGGRVDEPGPWGPERVADAVVAAEASMDRLDAVRARVAGGAANTHGGDPGLHRNRSTVVRHAVNYLVAVRAAQALAAGVDGPVVDVGAGTGAFSPLLAERLGRELHVVDTDPRHTALAAAAFPGTGVHTDLAAAPRGAVVTAMEVIEHLEPADQVGFVASLASAVLPGGAVVLSTPDESGYPRGWSGYAPHVGPLDAAGLARAVSRGTGGWPVTVLRVDGPTFSLTPVGALVQGTANRAWNLVSGVAAGLEPRVTGLVHRVTRDRPAAAVPPEGSWRVRPVGDDDGGWRSGTGLLALATAPAQA
ncbi:class I SAM-dependent methyltransferase [Streptomyces sp. NP160]|uniref:methyltransferase domain-containing protein n=1 Tax=Streptomyces sp. NP160 TaxID=2586637 RepID=UPI00111B4EBF|nr:methyltransferase domain-containing protein [Streptomyces sp. NP160]TNM67119.1 class I SAM-dependent methyltransferase [Streptomyces sp. NP160]